MQPQRKRLGADVRRKQIVTAAYRVACEDGYDAVTREHVAQRAKCSTGLINRWFGTVDALRDAMIDHAVAEAEAGHGGTETLVIIARALASGNERARAASAEVKERALATIIG